jgi:hypothetical protein
VVEMRRSASVSPLAREFDRFLFASIGEEKNGMVLSVVSALARLDVDPWQEAARLARLPPKTATQRLATLIATIPGERSAPEDCDTLAVRFVKLLPRPAVPSAAPLYGLFGTGEAAPYSMARYLISCAILLALLLGAQSNIASSQPPPQPERAPVVAAGAVVPHMQTPVVGN